MSPETLQSELENAVPKLLNMARELTWRPVSDNCTFILSEIRNVDKNAFELPQLERKENSQKIPVQLQELQPVLQNLYSNLYDINLYIYKASKRMTVIDIRYYLKSALDEEYRKTVIELPPMLHCKMELPPGMKKGKRFDINWKHKETLRWWWFWRKVQKINL